VPDKPLPIKCSDVRFLIDHTHAGISPCIRFTGNGPLKMCCREAGKTPMHPEPLVKSSKVSVSRAAASQISVGRVP